MHVFITGTDTDVGKTVITGLLAAAYYHAGKRVCIYKPVQTGAQDLSLPDDPEQIRSWLGNPPEVGFFASYVFRPPVAPWVADVDGSINLDTIEADWRRLQGEYDVVLTEGAGGVHVPITREATTMDLIQRLNCPVVVVARPNLGTINHTLLTVEALQSRHIPIEGVFISNYAPEPANLAEQTLSSVFKQFLNVPVLGYIPPMPLAANYLKDGLPSAIADMSYFKVM
jgi:dethiobiotin synthetase